MRSTGGIVLCGGQSSRMGRPKAWLSVGEETMLQRVVRIVGEVVSPVVVVAAPGQGVPPLPDGVRVVRDEVEGRGPLGGLAAGLAALAGECDAAYLSGCDVPLLRAGFVKRVVGFVDLTPRPPLHPWRGGVQGAQDPLSSPRPPEARDVSRSHARGDDQTPLMLNTPSPWMERGTGGEVSLTIPLIAGRLHPLAAVYSLDILPVVLSQLAANNLRMTHLPELVPSQVLTENDFADVDPQLESLRNVNTPEEYERVRQGVVGQNVGNVGNVGNVQNVARPVTPSEPGGAPSG